MRRSGGDMQVARWGEDLAVRLPADVVEALALKEGDEVQVDVHVKRTGREVSQMTRDEALERLRELRASAPALPVDYKFNREELHERGWMKKFEVEEKG